MIKVVNENTSLLKIDFPLCLDIHQANPSTLSPFSKLSGLLLAGFFFCILYFRISLEDAIKKPTGF